VKIIIASDHAGYSLKEKVKLSYEADWIDIGCHSADVSCSYSEYARKTAQKLLQGEVKKAILICGTGIGMSMAANRFKGIRAALCVNAKMAEMSRLHNDANVLCLGARLIDEKMALDITMTWLNTEFEGGRHIPRIKLMDEDTYV